MKDGEVLKLAKVNVYYENFYLETREIEVSITRDDDRYIIKTYDAIDDEEEIYDWKDDYVSALTEANHLINYLRKKA